VTQLMIWKRFFSSLPWQDLVPDQDHAIVTAGLGTLGNLQTRVSKSDFCTASKTPDGAFVVTYLPTARTITVEMASLKAPANAKWFDPSNGAYTTIRGGHLQTQERGDLRRPGTTTTATATGCCCWRCFRHQGLLSCKTHPPNRPPPRHRNRGERRRKNSKLGVAENLVVV
jgi:hypothetical protein